MKRGYILLALATMALVSPVAAQLSAKPRPPLTPEKRQIQDALLMLRDSLAAVQGGAARLQRDLANSSDAVTRTRSREISDACASSARASKSVQQTVATNPEPAKDAKQTRAGVIATLRELRTALDQCHADFARLSDPVMAEELRGYGVSRAERLDQPIGRYNLALAEYLGAVDIILPLQSISPEAH